ncbi:MAG: response regulator [Candidatus Synoicihabitans palmerolidicus]|nr:response regulator [Candidatus Synoicihabitans palmerolidicus]
MDLGSDQSKLISTDHLITGARRARDLVRQILTFSRHAEPERRLVDLHLIAEETLSLVRVASPQNVTFAYAPAPEPPKVLADPTQIHQVFMNLCTNAVHAIGDKNGRVTLSIQRVAHNPGPPGSSPVSHLAPGDYHCIEVGDNGGGMSAQTKTRMFEPFFTTKANSRGTGLGLCVVHGIIEQHHGTITVDREVFAGTRITIGLPTRDQSELEASVHQVDLTPVADDNPAILIIDDESAVNNALVRMLERLGCRATAYENPLDGLQAFRADPHRYRALLCDLSMPELNGLEVLREIR